MEQEGQTIITAPVKRRGRPPESIRLANRRRVIEIAKSNPDMSQIEVARESGACKRTVADVLAKYGINQGELEEYRNNQADIILGIQRKITTSITQEDVNKAPLRDRLIGLGITIDKHRLITGESTSNVASWTTIIQLVQTPAISNAPIDVTPKPD